MSNILLLTISPFCRFYSEEAKKVVNARNSEESNGHAPKRLQHHGTFLSTPKDENFTKTELKADLESKKERQLQKRGTFVSDPKASSPVVSREASAFIGTRDTADSPRRNSKFDAALKEADKLFDDTALSVETGGDISERNAISMGDVVAESVENVSNFISQMKSGEVPTKDSTDFRTRRLT